MVLASKAPALSAKALAAETLAVSPAAKVAEPVLAEIPLAAPVQLRPPLAE